jgi:hypothetical protein
VAKFGSQHGVGRKDDQGGDATNQHDPNDGQNCADDNDVGKRRAVTYFNFSRCPALNKSIAQTRRIIGRGRFHANFVALSDRDLSRLQTTNDAVATTASFKRIRSSAM